MNELRIWAKNEYHVRVLQKKQHLLDRIALFVHVCMFVYLCRKDTLPSVNKLLKKMSLAKIHCKNTLLAKKKKKTVLRIHWLPLRLTLPNVYLKFEGCIFKCLSDQHISVMTVSQHLIDMINSYISLSVTHQ